MRTPDSGSKTEGEGSEPSSEENPPETVFETVLGEAVMPRSLALGG